MRVLIGGMGIGMSLVEALADPRVTDVVVLEREPAVLRWHTGHLAGSTGGALDDPRVRVVCADLADVLTDILSAGGRFDAVCVDVDNGPDWTVTEGNGDLYGAAGLAALYAALRPGGRLTVWSAAAVPAFEQRLARQFAGPVRVLPVPVPRGEPDVVYLAQRPIDQGPEPDH